MTNKEECEDTSYETGAVDLLALHLINQVLEEASIIVNAAKNSDQPWSYVSSLKKSRNFRLHETYTEDLTYVVSKGDSQLNYENQENVVVTSTPQKIENRVAKLKNEAAFMGQGDEELEVNGYELRKSTSMFINHLFDMSDVERVVFTDEADMMQNRNYRSEELLKNPNDFKNEQQDNLKRNTNENSLNSKSEQNSSYSFLNDALCTNILQEYDFSKNYHDGKNNENNTLCDTDCELKNSPHNEILCVPNETIGKMNNNDLELYESAYATLNRDYEQYSEEEEPILQDPTAASMHEIDLITSTTSNVNVNSCQASDQKELKATSAVLSSGTGSRKSSIARRCRHQGAKLLSCLRGLWWRRKLLGKRKEPRVCGSIRGLCPLSPDARRRAASLLDQRNLRTPSPSRSVVWKFNTVNEALVNSSRWKDYDLETNLN